MKNLTSKYTAALAVVNERKAALKAAENELFEIQIEITRALEDMGVTEIKNGDGKFTMTTDLLPQITDMETLVKWAYENDAPHMLQKRPSKTAVNEYFEKNGYYPEGIECHVTNKLKFSNK